jgi:hypothetical protein
MSFENAFSIAAAVAESSLMILLFRRRVWRTLPVFFAYCACAFLCDTSASAITAFSRHGYGIGFYFVTNAIDFALQLSVLVEVTWSVLRPLRARLSLKALVLVAAVIVATGAAIWPFAALPGLSAPAGLWRISLQLQQTMSILRILFFVLLAAGSHLLSIGWRDRELQVATGFGFYSLVSLAVAAMNTHQVTAWQVGRLYWLVAISFLFSFFYWIFCFAQADAARREFTPQMQQTLLALARTAHLSRSAVANARAAGAEPQDNY